MIQALTESVKHRDVRVHDATRKEKLQGKTCKNYHISEYKELKEIEYHCESVTTESVDSVPVQWEKKWEDAG